MKSTERVIKQRSSLLLLLGVLLSWTIVLLEWPKPLAAQSACGTTSFGPPIRTATGIDRLSGSVVSDFNGDGIPDVAVADRVSGNIAIMLGDGFGGFRHSPGSLVMPGPSSSTVLAAADFNGDGRQDLAAGSFNPPPNNSIKLLLGDGAGRFNLAPGSPVSASQGIAALAVADFNGDGRADLAAGHIDADYVTLLLGDGSGGLSIAARPPVTFGISRFDVAVADFNGDNRPDLAVINSDRGWLSILLGNGDGTFSDAPGSPLNTGEQAKIGRAHV